MKTKLTKRNELKKEIKNLKNSIEKVKKQGRMGCILQFKKKILEQKQDRLKTLKA